MRITQQQQRLLELLTPLHGKNAFILTYFKGDEAISKPFHFYLDALSSIERIDPKEMIGKALTVKLNSAANPGAKRFNNSANTPRYFNGIVYEFNRAKKSRDGLYLYHFHLGPSSERMLKWAPAKKSL